MKDNDDWSFKQLSIYQTLFSNEIIKKTSLANLCILLLISLYYIMLSNFFVYVYHVRKSSHHLEISLTCTVIWNQFYNWKINKICILCSILTTVFRKCNYFSWALVTSMCSWKSQIITDLVSKTYFPVSMIIGIMFSSCS